MDEEITEIMHFVRMATTTKRGKNLDNVAETIVEARLANELRLAGRYFDSKIAIVNSQGMIRYSSEPNLTLNELKSIAEEAVNETKYIFQRENIKINNVEMGYVIVYTAVDDVVSLRNLGFQVFTLSFSVGGVLALLISLLFQSVIGKPIKKNLVEL